MDTGRVVPTDGGSRPQVIVDGRRQGAPGRKRQPRRAPGAPGGEEAPESPAGEGTGGHLDLFA